MGKLMQTVVATAALLAGGANLGFAAGPGATPTIAVP
jgi:hypothetical protein